MHEAVLIQKIEGQVAKVPFAGTAFRCRQALEAFAGFHDGESGYTVTRQPDHVEVSNIEGTVLWTWTVVLLENTVVLE